MHGQQNIKIFANIVEKPASSIIRVKSLIFLFTVSYNLTILRLNSVYNCLFANSILYTS